MLDMVFSLIKKLLHCDLFDLATKCYMRLGPLNLHLLIVFVGNEEATLQKKLYKEVEGVVFVVDDDFGLILI